MINCKSNAFIIWSKYMPAKTNHCAMCIRISRTRPGELSSNPSIYRRDSYYTVRSHFMERNRDRWMDSPWNRFAGFDYTTKFRVALPFYCQWEKRANNAELSSIVPVPKEGDAADMANYRARGISMQNTILKIIDKVLTAKLQSALRPIIPSCQHGFVPERGPVSILTEACDVILKSFVARHYTKVI